MEYAFYIIWNANPEIISGLPPRWYGLLFASGFLIGSYIMRWIYKLDGRDPEEVERLTLYMVIATIVGARVGHCLFYDPVYYLSNPLKILYIWEGGLASHGAAISIIILILIGSVSSLKFVISLIDLSYGIMAFPTLISALILAPKVDKMAKDYFKKLN